MWLIVGDLCYHCWFAVTCIPRGTVVLKNRQRLLLEISSVEYGPVNAWLFIKPILGFIKVSPSLFASSRCMESVTLQNLIFGLETICLWAKKSSFDMQSTCMKPI